METRQLPLGTVTLAFGLLSIPLAFARQLCVPALIMGLLAILFHFMGRLLRGRRTYAAGSIRRSVWGFRLALAGSVCAAVMWTLWATGTLL